MSAWISAFGLIEFTAMLYGEYEGINLETMVSDIIGPASTIPSGSEGSLNYSIGCIPSPENTSGEFTVRIFIDGRLRDREEGSDIITWFQGIVQKLSDKEYIVCMDYVIKVTNSDYTILMA